ncbi:MAG: endonuclease III [Coriobacteriales bacterium]|nr:endonuclease III [Coriobacteriales bacterium]
MPRESKKSKVARVTEFCHRMDELYGSEPSALDWHTPFELVIAVLLSAQTTDAAVNAVTPDLFGRWPDAASMACADVAEVADVIHRLGFFNSKSQHCVGCAQMIVADYGGEVPRTMDELVRLPGVGRKTANIVLNKAFGIVEGIAVDTHVFRIAQRMGLTTAKTPLDAEKDLLAVIPQELWGGVNSQWIRFGRATCTARQAKCETCPCDDLCPKRPVRHGAGQAKKRPRRKKG